ncbi:membrane protein [Elusimicrobium simillimum]|uniref:NfeD family protein n=1 Tax=Elusimicrobium simillimum TaxID=3143438 RepID=UPI003C6FD928
MSMPIYYWWIIIGIILIIGEIFTLDFALSCFGIAFLAAAVPAYFGASFFWQAICFAVVAVTLFFTLRPFALKYLNKGAKLKTGADALIDRKGVVTEEINEAAGTGRVQIDGDFWKAVSSETVAKGAEVKVAKIDGIILTVNKI